MPPSSHGANPMKRLWTRTGSGSTPRVTGESCVAGRCGPCSSLVEMMTVLFLLLFSSRLYFKTPDKGDMGTYSVSVSDTEGVSSSFVLDEEGKSPQHQPALWFVLCSRTESAQRRACVCGRLGTGPAHWSPGAFTD